VEQKKSSKRSCTGWHVDTQMATMVGEKRRQSLRIIAGQWRGRRLQFTAQTGLRPTGDRLRETLFNWLAQLLPGTHCLDLFAGSGALGLEALSRGAASTTFVELSRVASSQLERNLALLKLARGQQAQVINQNAMEWLKQPCDQVYDLVFLDPPFALALMDDLLAKLHQGRLLKALGQVYIEQPRPLAELHLPEGWQVKCHKRAGKVYYGLLQMLPQENFCKRQRIDVY
jgi:16S rRNA (guanine966-N2)-methyltransferase